MDQIAMFKNSQEFASEKVLYKSKTIEWDAYIKFKNTIKYLPAALPVNPNPSCDILTIHIKKEYLQETSVVDINVTLVEAIQEEENICHSLWKKSDRRYRLTL